MTLAAAWQRARGVLVGALLLGAAWPVWKAFVAQRPVISWYFPRLAVTWLLVLLFCVSSLAIGVRVVKALTGPVSRDGFWALSFASGVLIYGMSLGVAGHLQLFGPILFGMLPLALLAAGWGPLAEELLAARARW